MTRVLLLKELTAVTEDAVKDLILPVRLQEESDVASLRAPEVWYPRLPDGSAAKKKAPYILHQVLTSRDRQAVGENPKGSCTVRTIFCVYHPDEREGALTLLGLMERVRIRLLRQVVIGNQFQLDLQEGVEYLVYPDNTAPYYAGEMSTVWKMPAVTREVSPWTP